MLFSSQRKFVDFNKWDVDALHQNPNKRQLSFIWMLMQCIECLLKVAPFQQESDALHRIPVRKGVFSCLISAVLTQ